MQLNRGDAIVLYTDGLVEAQDAQGSNFGTEGIARAALECLNLAPKQMAAHIVDAAGRHCGDSSHLDDMTALVVRFGGPKEG